MTSILASSSDDEGEETHAAGKNAVEDIERYHKVESIEQVKTGCKGGKKR